MPEDLSSLARRAVAVQEQCPQTSFAPVVLRMFAKNNGVIYPSMPYYQRVLGLRRALGLPTIFVGAGDFGVNSIVIGHHGASLDTLLVACALHWHTTMQDWVVADSSTQMFVDAPWNTIFPVVKAVAPDLPLPTDQQVEYVRKIWHMKE